MYASETQFEFAKRWRGIDRLVGSFSAGVAAIAGVGGLSHVFSIQLVGLIAIVAAFSGAVAASIGAPQTKQKASFSANAYRSLQQDVRIFLTIDLMVLDEHEAEAALKKLVERLQQLNQESVIPRSAKAWQRAKRQIESGSQSYQDEK